MDQLDVSHLVVFVGRHVLFRGVGFVLEGFVWLCGLRLADELDVSQGFALGGVCFCGC